MMKMTQIPPTFASGANALFCGDVVIVKRVYMFDPAAGDYLYLIDNAGPGLATLAYGADLVNGNTD
jgi:hypothetical protein